MILTNCPVCAAPLPDTSAKQCSRCKTRYCGPACQKQHWEEGGHDKLCTLDDVREAVATLDELARTTRRKFGVAHPLAVTVAEDLQNVQGKLRKQEELEDMGISSLAEAKEMLNAMEAMTTGDI